jgi:hypothetical protein
LSIEDPVQRAHLIARPPVGEALIFLTSFSIRISAAMRHAKMKSWGDRSEGAFDDAKNIRFQDCIGDS